MLRRRLPLDIYLCPKQASDPLATAEISNIQVSHVPIDASKSIALKKDTTIEECLFLMKQILPLDDLTLQNFLTETINDNSCFVDKAQFQVPSKLKMSTSLQSQNGKSSPSFSKIFMDKLMANMDEVVQKNMELSQVSATLLKKLSESDTKDDLEKALALSEYEMEYQKNYEKYVKFITQDPDFVTGAETSLVETVKSADTVSQGDVVADQSALKELLSMGFSKQNSIEALEKTASLEDAILLLLESPQDQRKTSVSSAPASPPSLIGLSSSTAQNILKLRERLKTENTKLEQKFMDTRRVFSAPFSTITRLLEKDKSQTVDYADWNESFSVKVGSSHLKHTQTIRLMVTQLDSLFTSSYADIPTLSQTLLTLYSKQLTGVLMYHEPYNMGAYKQFLKLTRERYDLHFGPLEAQISKIPTDKMEDIYTTLHSTMQPAHVVFHSKYDNSLQKLKSILKQKLMATLYVPLFPDVQLSGNANNAAAGSSSGNSTPTSQSTIRATESLLKCLKSCWMENSDGYECTIIITVPPWAVTNKDTFNSMCDLVRSMFRTV